MTVSGLNTQPEKVIGLSACAARERTLLAASQVPRTPAFLRNVRRSIVLMGTLSLGLGRLGRRRVLACAHAAGWKKVTGLCASHLAVVKAAATAGARRSRRGRGQ